MPVTLSLVSLHAITYPCINSDQGGLWAMCPVSSGFLFKGDQQSYHWLELSPPPQQVQIGDLQSVVPYCGFYTHSVFGQKENDASLNWHIILLKHAKCSCQPLLVNIYLKSSQAWNISYPEKTGWWFWTFGIWNLWQGIEIQPFVCCQRLLACQGKMYFIQPQAWPLRALKGLTYSKVHYWPLH